MILLLKIDFYCWDIIKDRFCFWDIIKDRLCFFEERFLVLGYCIWVSGDELWSDGLIVWLWVLCWMMNRYCYFVITWYIVGSYGSIIELFILSMEDTIYRDYWWFIFVYGIVLLLCWDEAWWITFQVVVLVLCIIENLLWIVGVIGIFFFGRKF